MLKNSAYDTYLAQQNQANETYNATVSQAKTQFNYDIESLKGRIESESAIELMLRAIILYSITDGGKNKVSKDIDVKIF